jgi:hypothetical protein
MNAQELLQEISDYCRHTGLAESTFGRRAVNDGKLASRLRHGGRITTETLDRIRSFMQSNREPGARPAVIARTPEHVAAPAPVTAISSPAMAPSSEGSDPQSNFRFFDNRQKYLLFVHTCSEKWVVANRVSLELANIHPRPPALRLFDAGVGDGTVLLRTLRAMHDKFPHTPFYVVGKEISLEDVRLAMQKMSDRGRSASATRRSSRPRPCWWPSRSSSSTSSSSGTSCAGFSRAQSRSKQWHRSGWPTSAVAPPAPPGPWRPSSTITASALRDRRSCSSTSMPSG